MAMDEHHWQGARPMGRIQEHPKPNDPGESLCLYHACKNRLGAEYLCIEIRVAIAPSHSSGEQYAEAVFTDCGGNTGDSAQVHQTPDTQPSRVVSERSGSWHHKLSKSWRWGIDATALIH